MESTEAADGRTRGISWRRLAAEGAAIVVSILLAFSIDAWWDSQKDLVEEQDHLAALYTEFEVVGQMIRGEVAQMQDAADATRRLLAMNAEQAASTDSDSLAALFTRIFRVGRANLPSGALGALMASGGLTLIRDRELAMRLASWPSLVAEVYENASWLMEHRERQVVPFLHGYVGGLWISRKSGLLDDYPNTRFAPRIEALFSDSRLEGYLSATAVRIQVILARYRTLAQEADAIAASVERQLSG